MPESPHPGLQKLGKQTAATTVTTHLARAFLAATGGKLHKLYCYTPLKLACVTASWSSRNTLDCWHWLTPKAVQKLAAQTRQIDSGLHSPTEGKQDTHITKFCIWTCTRGSPEYRFSPDMLIWCGKVSRLCESCCTCWWGVGRCLSQWLCCDHLCCHRRWQQPCRFCN